MLHRLLLAGGALAALVLASCGERSAPSQATASASGTETAAASSATADAADAAVSTATPTPSPTSTPTSTSTSTSTPPAPTQIPPRPPPPPSAAMLVRAVAAVEPAGRVVLVRDVETVIDPAATFEVELGASVPDARLLLVDPSDAHVEASAAREVAATTKVSLAPAAPLVPGSRYLLRLDGAASRELHDTAGRAYGPVSFPLLVAGKPQPPEPRKKPRRRR